MAFGSSLATPFLYAAAGIAGVFCTAWLVSKLHYAARVPIVAIPAGTLLTGSIALGIGTLISGSGPYQMLPPAVSLPIELAVAIPFAAIVFVPVSVMAAALSVSLFTTIAFSVVANSSDHPYITGIYSVSFTIFGIFIFFGCILSIISKRNRKLIGQPYSATLLLNASVGVLLGAGVYFINFTVGTIATLFLVMLILVPIVNGMCDWASWWLSRILGSHLRTQLRMARSKWVYCSLITKHGLADFVMALMTLASVVFLLGFAYELVDQISPGTVSRINFQPEIWIDTLVSGPLGSGLWFTMMLVSTLVPTAAHLLFLILSPLVMFSRDDENRHRLSSLLIPGTYNSLGDEQKFDLTREAAEWRDKQHRRPVLWAIAGLVAFLVINLFIIGTDKVIESSVDGNFGLGKVIGQVAHLGVNVAEEFFSFR